MTGLSSRPDPQPARPTNVVAGRQTFPTRAPGRSWPSSDRTYGGTTSVPPVIKLPLRPAPTFTLAFNDWWNNARRLE